MTDIRALLSNNIKKRRELLGISQAVFRRPFPVRGHKRVSRGLKSRYYLSIRKPYAVE